MLSFLFYNHSKLIKKMNLFKTVERKTTSFKIGDRVITLRLVKQKNKPVYGVVYAIRNPADSKVSPEKEALIVSSILKGRAEQNVFLEKNINGNFFSLCNIICNVLTHTMATEVLETVKTDMINNFQSYVKFKV